MLTDTSLEFHPAANLFPMLTGDEYEQLKADMAANGQLEPIWIHPDGRILDGRNRYMACCDLGIEPKVRQWNGGGSAVGFVVSLNIHRRHLTASQRAAIALDVLPMLEDEARARKATSAPGVYGGKPLTELVPEAVGGESREQAASMFHTNSRYVQEAKNIRHDAPDLYEAVKTGELTIPQAKHELLERKRDELRANPVPLPLGRYSTIVVDPPWPMEKIEREVAPNQFSFDYPTMTLDEITNWTGAIDIAADDCHLFIWTTQKFLPATFDIMKAWGFRYVLTMVWHKAGGFQPYDLPQYNCEFVLYGRKGSPRFVDTKAFMTCFDGARTGHSVKPSELYETLARTCPGPRIEMFGRSARAGFDSWGNESDEQRREAGHGVAVGIL